MDEADQFSDSAHLDQELQQTEVNYCFSTVNKLKIKAKEEPEVEILTSKRVRKSSVKFEDVDVTNSANYDRKGKSNAPKKFRLQNIATQKVVLVRQSAPENKVMTSVVISNIDKASQLTLSEDQLICHGCDGGYRMARATHGIHRGTYFFEVEILEPNGVDAHVRLGWSTRQGELQGPVGFDEYSYAYRDIKGSKVYKSIRDDSYGEPFGVGDIIGCYICIDDNPKNNCIQFFKNGKCQGIAYQGSDIHPAALYYPAISLYNKAAVRVNFGPTFILHYDIPNAYPISELQPLHPQDRIIHDKLILSLRKGRVERLDSNVAKEELIFMEN